MAIKSVALLVLAASRTVDAAGTLALTWTDCGDASTHAKVTGVTPTSITLGQNTPAVGTGVVDEAVTGGSFSIDLNAGIIKQHWTGDICTKKTFTLPLGAGSVTWDGMACPIAKGNTSVSLEILLSALLPSSLATSTINVAATTSSGDKLLCMKLNTAPSSQFLADTIAPLPTPPPSPLSSATQDAANGGSLALSWKDCGDASTHGKVSGLTPSTLILGTKTHATATCNIDEAVSDGAFTIDVKAGFIKKTLTGDLCAAKTFDLPLGAGSVAWDGLKCPLAAGSINVPLDIMLSSAIPASLATATFSVNALSTSGDKLLCMEVDTKPSATEMQAAIVV